MTREERDQLLARYNNGELSPVEREKLFSEALQDQELFDLLFEDETLNEALADPEVRRDLMAAPLPRRAGWHERWRWPVLAALAVSVVAGVFLIREQMEPEKPVMVARSVPEPVRSIEPIVAPMPDTLSLPPARVEPRRVDEVAVAKKSEKVAETGAVVAMDAAAESFAAAAPAGTPAAAPAAPARMAMMARAVAAAVPLETRFEVQSGDGTWRSLEEHGAAPAGRPVRLAVVGREVVAVRVGSERALVRPGETRYFPLPGLGVGEHEIRIEWSGATEPDAVSTFAEAGRSGTAGPGSRVLRLRVE